MSTTSFESNPFGDNHSTYYGGFEPIDFPEKKSSRILKRGSKKVSYATFAIVVSLLVLVVAYVIDCVVVHNMSKEAKLSIVSMNHSMENVSEVFDNEELLGALREQSHLRGGNEKLALSTAADFGRKVSDDPQTLAFDMNNQEAALAVVNYYALCESMDKIPNGTPGVDDGVKACQELSDTAMTMMSNIKKYNSVADSVAGKIVVPEKKALPDVTQL